MNDSFSNLGNGMYRMAYIGKIDIYAVENMQSLTMGREKLRKRLLYKKICS